MYGIFPEMLGPNIIGYFHSVTDSLAPIESLTNGVFTINRATYAFGPTSDTALSPANFSLSASQYRRTYTDNGKVRSLSLTLNYIIKS